MRDMTREPLSSVRTLLSSIVDYAGLFPPAGLDMQTTVRNYASYLQSEHSWMLGRIVVPVARLREFKQAAAELLPKGETDDPWRISALTGGLGDSLNADIDTIFSFNAHHDEKPEGGRVVIDTIELKAGSAHAIDEAMQIIPEQIQPFFEIDWKNDIRGSIAALAGTGGCAKIRTGGVTADLIPPVDAVAHFLTTCASAEVTFKATAGLHHPIRAEYKLTYEKNSPRAVMHGFLNVFVGAALARTRRADRDDVARVLSETDAKSFVFDESGLKWRDYTLDLVALARVRESFAISFGSCSFEEPVGEMVSLVNQRL